MSDSSGPKSAYEIAMERLRKKDEETGVEQRHVSDEQKVALAEIRNFYEAKIAEQTVLHESTMRRSVDAAERDTLAQQHRREIEHLNAARDAKIEKIRRGDT